MVDEIIILLLSTEMAEHANLVAQHLGVLLGGRYVVKEQTRDMDDFLFSGIKRNIECSPFSPQEEKGCRDTSKCSKLLLYLLMNMTGYWKKQTIRCLKTGQKEDKRG